MRIGLDIGATKVLGAVVAADGSIVAQSREVTAPGADGVLATAMTVLGQLAAALGGALPRRIGIGIPGIVDRGRGAVSHAVNLGLGSVWFPLADRLADRTGAAVMVENDLNAATWGTHVLFGADDLAYVSLGTGLAAGFVLDGVLRRGAHGAAGEIGHVPVDPGGPLCSCGQRGCLELIAAGSALTAAWPTDGETSPAAALFPAAAAGDPAAVAVRGRFAAGVADAIRMLGLAVDPAAIIIGGGVANLGEPLLAAVTAALRAQAATSPFLAALDLAARVRLVPAGVPVGAIGAAMIWDASEGKLLMEVVPLGSADEIAAVVADVFEAVVRRKRDAVLGLATGSTPLPAYRELIRRHEAGTGPSYAAVACFNLDEYVGLPAGHEQSYRATIARELTDGLGISPERVNGPDPNPDGLPTAGEHYEALIEAAGGIDVQLLGIGSDGHLAFNEPGSSLASRTRIKTLTAQTQKDNARFFGSPGQVPTHVLTQGLGTILQARHLLLVATDAGKAAAVAAAVEGPVSASCPASVLQLHPHATVLLDPPAASRLERLGYYREVYAAKPAWQGL
jgi:glucosamine-6-phosphate isomerase